MAFVQESRGGHHPGGRGSLLGAVASVEERGITRAPRGFHGAALGGKPTAGFSLPLCGNPSQALPASPVSFEI